MFRSFFFVQLQLASRTLAPFSIARIFRSEFDIILSFARLMYYSNT